MSSVGRWEAGPRAQTQPERSRGRSASQRSSTENAVFIRKYCGYWVSLEALLEGCCFVLVFVFFVFVNICFLSLELVWKQLGLGLSLSPSLFISVSISFCLYLSPSLCFQHVLSLSLSHLYLYQCFSTVTFCPRGHWAMSRDIFGGHNWIEAPLVRSRCNREMLIKILEGTRQPLRTKRCSSQNICNVVDKNPWLRALHRLKKSSVQTICGSNRQHLCPYLCFSTWSYQ